MLNPSLESSARACFFRRVQKASTVDASMPYTSQADVDAAFADLDALLEKRQTGDDGRVACPGCGGTHFERCANPGMGVQFYSCCVDCGAVQATNFGCSDAELRPRRPFSNYKRIHHWHERISQLMLCESRIPDEAMLQIAERLCDGSHAFINKDVIRGVLRSLNMSSSLRSGSRSSSASLASSRPSRGRC